MFVDGRFMEVIPNLRYELEAAMQAFRRFILRTMDLKLHLQPYIRQRGLAVQIG